MGEFNLETSHTAAFWDERYAGHEPVWSGQANQRLVEQVGDLDPGTALDIGCGEGGDAVWLAQRGWTVLAVDVSSIAVDKARTHAEATLRPEIAGRITWQQADIRTWQPPADAFDLVSMHYIHLPRALLADVQARLVPAVRRGGNVLIVNHDPLDLLTTARRPEVHELFLTAEEVVSGLDPRSWRVAVADVLTRPATDHDGNEITIQDAVIRAVRR
jgi:SAM-dependent methyltransferase